MKIRGLKNQAWVTSAVTDDDAKRSIVLANSLKRVLSNRSVVILASNKVSGGLRERLHYEFDQVFILEEDRNTVNLKHEDFAKLSALTLKSYEKCIFVSARMMFLKNADDLFDRYENSHFAPIENDTSLPIFLYKPSMESYSVLMKALASRNGTPVSSYIQNWFRNQHSNQRAAEQGSFLELKYNRKISLQLQKNDALSNASIMMMDTVIVNFVDDVMLDEIWNESDHKYLGLVELHAVKNWMELYQEHVVGISNPLYATPGIKKDVSKEPIAIIGMSCRYPGSNSLEEFWNLLFNGEDGTGTPPPFRWLREQSSRNRPECRNTNAGFLKVPVDEFDAKFFGISPKEAEFLDPQHRILHELVWEGLEDAAVDPLMLRGSNGGVFMGSWTNDFKDILTHAGVSEFYRTYMGNSVGAASARISFLLGLTGPSVATESGCSSAMVAVHLACRSLQLGETNFALACGVNLLLHPFDKDEMPMVISPEGRCKTFDAKADGFARGEGCGVLVLKRLSDAIKEGDNIWALIRGSAVSQEGVSRSMGTPTVHCESIAMQLALKDAEVEPHEVSYVEAHGTGTVVGDPMEVSAIAKAYGSNSRKEPLIIGSVKTNVGHTESCSGITGIMKVVLAMQHNLIPPHRNFESLNPNINLEAVPAMIPLKAEVWKRDEETGKRRIAGVSSFGITGTDAHAIIEEFSMENDLPQTKLVSSLERPQHLLKISAKTEEALSSLLEKYADCIENSTNSIADIAYTANTGRANFPWRIVLTGKSGEEIVTKIRQNQATKQEVASEDIGKICFLFTGQGSQYPNMAKELYETNPIFQMHFDFCENILQKKYNISIKQVLWGETTDKSEVSRTIYSQTAIFCVEFALLKLWESWGVKPDYALGHSLGEFCAAVCAGILTPEDAIMLVAERSRLIDDLPRGKMLVIKAGKETVNKAMRQFADGDSSKILDYAAVNSCEQTVVAGDTDVVLDFAQFVKESKNLKSIVLEATHAFHSKHMDPMLEEYRSIAETVKKPGCNEWKCEYISGMKGKIIEDFNSIGADYWVQHTRQPVSFLAASKASTQEGCQIFIEVGPQPVLSALTMMNNDGNLMCLPSLKRNETEWDTILQTVGKLYMKGVSIDWNGFEELYSRKKVRLPHYPFFGKKFWPDMLATTGNSIHPLLGGLIPNASSTKLFQNAINLRNVPYVQDHLIGSTAVFPGCGYLEMSLAAGLGTVECSTDSLAKPTRPMKVENLTIAAPLALEESKACQVQVVVDFNNTNDATKGNEDWNDLSVKIFHRLDSKWLLHASSTFTPLPSAEEIKAVQTFNCEELHRLQQLPSDDQMITQVYEKLASVGLKFGPIFQSIEKVWKDGDGDNAGMLAKVKLPPVTTSSGGGGDSLQYIIHPVILDAMIQAVMIQRHSDQIKKKLYVPISISKFLWLDSQKGEELFIYTTSKEGQSVSSEALLVDELGTIIAVMSGVELIDTTVKAVESVLEQQTSVMPDLWEESWRGKQGPMQHRLAESILGENVYNVEFIEYISKTYNVTPEDKEEIFKKLEKFVFYWILNGLYECGWKPIQNQKFSLDQLVIQLGIGETHKKFVKYFMEVLAQEGIVKEEEGGSAASSWKIISMPENHEKVKAHLSQPYYSEELAKKFDPTRLIQRVGENLSSIFKGTQSPLHVLFPEDTKNNASVAGFYDDYGSTFNVAGTVVEVQKKRLQSWLEKLKEQGKEGEKFVFRILEVGAGTGAFTSRILPVIDEMGVEYEYTYTDISQAFFSTAEKRFEKFKGNLKFKKLNIEEDPVMQGFCPGYYDYVVASDVIHATKDIVQTLKNVRNLMRTGGNMDIMEQIQKNRVVTFIFGLMEGFWRFEDFRKDHCILTKEVWSNCLVKSGFKIPTVFPSFTGRHGLITTWACQDTEKISKRVMMSANQLNTSAQTWLVYSPSKECKVAAFILNKLATADRQAVNILPGEKFEEASANEFKIRGNMKEDFENLMEIMKSQKIPVEGIVYLWALDKNRKEQHDILQPYFYLAQSIFSLKQKVMPRFCAVTQGVAPVGDCDLSHCHPSTLWGFTKAFRNENTDVNCRCISITNDGKYLSENELNEVYYEIWSDDKEPQVAFAGGIRHVARFQPVKANSQGLNLPSGTNRFQLILPETKSIGDLQFGPLDHLILEEGEIEIQVKASALNFRDVFSVLKPTEKFKDINAVGFDFAGVVKKISDSVTKWKVGDYVFGVNVNGAALPSHIKLNENDVLPVPENMTLCEAATLPAVFSTAYYCLIDVAKIKKEDTILIHTASGGVGLSAIEIAKSIGATIIATAGSKRKQNYLRSLGIQHIFHSRNTNYGDEILKATNGRGVDVVLNSLTSEGFKEATLKACAKGARFVEMSKLSIWEPEEVKKLRSDVEYTIVDVSSAEPDEWRRLMSCLQALSEKKVVNPIPYVRFDGVNIREALQYLQKAKHIGKVVCVMPELRMEDGQYKAYTPQFSDRGTYLITGGLGGIGFEVAKWMLNKGAKHILLGSRSKPGLQTKAIIDQLNSDGANLIPVQLDVGNYEQCKSLLEMVKTEWKLPQLRGIMHAAGTLSDGLIVNQEWSKLASTFNSKINGTLNLHELTLGYPLEHFVLFSSIASLYGSPGQCNHAAGNNFEDTFAHCRNSVGLCATTVNWGQWGEIGVAVEVDLPGLKALSTLQGISALEYVMKTQRVQTCVMNMESFVLFSKLSPQTAVYLDERIWKAGSSSNSSMTIKSDEFWQQYDSKQENEEKLALIKFQLKDILRKILKLDNEEPIEDEVNFQDMGVDSLMFVEIKNAVQALLGDRVAVSASALRDCNNTKLLSEQLMKLIEGDDSEQEKPPTQEEVNELLMADCQLPEHITTGGRIAAKSISEISKVLLTGATGTLGPYILKELASLPKITEIYCMVRAGKNQTMEEKLAKVLEFKDLIPLVDMSKVKFVSGNVSKPKLGMEEEDWKTLTEEVDAIFHCAVKADHTQYYRNRDASGIEDVRAVNIRGTKNMLEFACEGQVKHVFFASSLLSVATTEEDGTLSESWPESTDFDGVTTFAYANTKFVGDVLMKTAVKERGIPAKVIRFPLIAGDSQTGKFNVEQNHMMLRYLFIMKSGVMPSNPFPMAILPVDTCAAISIKLFFKEELSTQSDIYNITHPSPDLDQEFPSLAESFGCPVDFVEFSEFAETLFSEPDGSTFSMFKEIYKNEEELMAVYTIAASLRKWLEGVEDFWVSKKLASHLPEAYLGLGRTIETLERDLRYAKNEGYFEKFGLNSRSSET